MAVAPLVSIVLPTFNGARYLAQSIQSCIDQTYRNWELIIVDDASTDETPSIILQFVGADERIQTIRHEENSGTAAALNAGFSLAKGDLLTWTSDDNFYRPNALEEMVNFLQERPEVGLVYSDWTSVTVRGDSCVLKRVVVENPDTLIHKCCVGPSFMYRREVQEKTGEYDVDASTTQDYDFWLRAMMRFQFAALHMDLYCYRYHQAAGTAKLGRCAAVNAAIRVLRKHLSRGINADEKWRILMHLAKLELVRHEPTQAFKDFLRASLFLHSAAVRKASLALQRGFRAPVDRGGRPA